MKNKTSVLYGMAIGAILAALLATIVGMGIKHEWPADHWGPLSAWVTGLMTAGALTVALVNTARTAQAQRDTEHERAIDHELTRRREMITAVSELWASLDAFAPDFATYVDLCRRFTLTFAEDPDRALERYGDAMEDKFKVMMASWVGASAKAFAADIIVSGDELSASLRELRARQERVLKAIEVHGGVIQSDDPTDTDHEALRRAWRRSMEMREKHRTILKGRSYSLDREAASEAVNATR